ncbi:AAA family ATPase [Pedobacter nyackensis]|uniref:AAA domain-containing protein n=1 Tax=Pedobacter nyackensis TaxID=475255 RepID=A0A1W1ZW15_9SPHI|nr:AAA family ATPase [Pedobacter nyackensis]SMC52597.1 AAA domain-containing protein [Pedobacter nyackensis]
MIVQKLIDDINAEAEEQKDIQTLIRGSLIPQGVKIPEPDVVFGVNGVPVFTKKSISTLIGRAKSGKTTVTSWIVSESIKNDLNVVWIDTEQGLYYGSRTQFWILSMSGLKISDYLKFYDLKIFPPNQRVEMIELIIKEFRPDLVVVDGIRDLVFDINNPEEATRRTGDLMRWADQYDCHILNILHQNKGNEHARGHLGTEMINKSESVIKVEQNEDGLIVCNPEYTRSKAFELFAFDRDEKGMPFIVDGYAGKITTNISSSKKGIDPTDLAYNNAHPEIVDKVFSKDQFLKYNDFVQNIKYYFQLNGIEMGRNKAIEFATHYLMLGMVWKNPHIKGYAKYEKNPLFDPMVLVVSGSKINKQADGDAPF